jgi:3-dehydroquinate dehydratase type II
VARLLLLNGPNLDLLGSREVERYGATDLRTLETDLTAQAGAAGHELECYQSDAEHELMARVKRAALDGVACAVINPAAYTHTSIALRDALLGVGLPFVEVHITDIGAREPFRAHSYFSDVALATVSGEGIGGYGRALDIAINHVGAVETARKS